MFKTGCPINPNSKQAEWEGEPHRYSSEKGTDIGKPYLA